jgi:hypothetical protein
VLSSRARKISGTNFRRQAIPNRANPIKKTVSLLLLAAGVLSMLPAASAHHGFAAEYDRSKQITLVGKLTKVELENPHGWLYMDAKNDQGRMVNWALELPGPAVLRRNGFDQSIYQTLMTAGEVVTVTASAARDGSKHAFGISLLRADGQTKIPLGRLPGGGPGGPGGRNRNDGGDNDGGGHGRNQSQQQ